MITTLHLRQHPHVPWTEHNWDLRHIKERIRVAHRHGEVLVGVVVVEDVADHLVEHGEEGVECTQAGKVHDVVQLLGKLECLHH